MRDTKRQIVRCAFYDQTTMQKQFKKMASQGWLIETISAYFWTYRRIEPTNLHITVTYFPTASEFDPGPSENQQLMEEFAARDGWKLLTRWGQIQVFCNESEDPTPIETDPVIQVDTIWRAMRKNLIPSHLMILALGLYQLIFNGYRLFTDTVDFLTTPYLLTSIPLWALLLLAEINELITCFCWHRKAKPAAENGIFIPVKTNHFITFCLIVSCLCILFNTLLLPTGLQAFSLVWITVMIGIIIIANFSKRWLKRVGASKGTNYTITILLIIILTFMFLGIMTVYIILNGLDDGRTPVASYEQNGWTFDIYDEHMPLYVEDLMEIGDSIWSRERNKHDETILASRSEYRQNHVQGGPSGLKDLEYTIIDIKLPFLYDTVKEAMLMERQDEVDGDMIFINHYEPIDATIWDASTAYQLHWNESILDTYLVCWNNRIVEIMFFWPPTSEQIEIVVDKLKQ